MKGQSNTVFVPELSAFDWLSLGFLLVLAVGLLVAAVLVLRRSRFSIRRCAAAAAAAGLSVGAVGALLYERAPILASVRFSDSHMIIGMPGPSRRILLTRGNEVYREAGGVRLISGGEEVFLPGVGSWRFGNIVVDADFLANEFRGRSAARQ